MGMFPLVSLKHCLWYKSVVLYYTTIVLVRAIGSTALTEQLFIKIKHQWTCMQNACKYKCYYCALAIVWNKICSYIIKTVVQ